MLHCLFVILLHSFTLQRSNSTHSYIHTETPRHIYTHIHTHIHTYANYPLRPRLFPTSVCPTHPFESAEATAVHYSYSTRGLQIVIAHTISSWSASSLPRSSAACASSSAVGALPPSSHAAVGPPDCRRTRSAGFVTGSFRSCSAPTATQWLVGRQVEQGELDAMIDCLMASQHTLYQNRLQHNTTLTVYVSYKLPSPLCLFVC